MHAGLASWNFDRMFTGDVCCVCVEGWGGGGENVCSKLPVLSSD